MKKISNFLLAIIISFLFVSLIIINISNNKSTQKHIATNEKIDIIMFSSPQKKINFIKSHATKKLISKKRKLYNDTLKNKNIDSVLTAKESYKNTINQNHSNNFKKNIPKNSYKNKEIRYSISIPKTKYPPLAKAMKIEKKFTINFKYFNHKISIINNTKPDQFGFLKNIKESLKNIKVIPEPKHEIILEKNFIFKLDK